MLRLMFFPFRKTPVFVEEFMQHWYKWASHTKHSEVGCLEKCIYMFVSALLCLCLYWWVKDYRVVKKKKKKRSAVQRASFTAFVTEAVCCSHDNRKTGEHMKTNPFPQIFIIALTLNLTQTYSIHPHTGIYTHRTVDTKYTHTDIQTHS